MNKPPANQPTPRQPQSPTLSVSAQIVTGPLPDPNILARYDQVVAGAAERIIAMAERDSVHLQSVEKMRISAVFHERRLGQIFGFSIAIIALGASVFLAYTGHETTASVIGGTTLLGLVSIFVIGRLTRPTPSKPN
nr:DUF2335 domain-containing protein [Nitrospirota bacterium]